MSSLSSLTRAGLRSMFLALSYPLDVRERVAGDG